MNGFLLQNCVPTKEHLDENVADADTKQEAQSVKLLSLTELEEAVKLGRFVEVQWTAAVALSLLHLKE